jgi:hypothetical protein
MKVTINIDCTPEEARTFFGLPDVQPLQERLLKEMEQRLSATMQAMSPEAMMQTWMSGFRNLGEMREKFLAGMGGAGETKP